MLIISFLSSQSNVPDNTGVETGRLLSDIYAKLGLIRPSWTSKILWYVPQLMQSTTTELWNVFYRVNMFYMHV
jgi:hypothetical protein